MTDPQQEAVAIEAEAWKIIKAFEDEAERIGADRRVQYAALIMMMTSFCMSSPASPAEILADFTRRVGSIEKATHDRPHH